jgi:hypothetical protein
MKKVVINESEGDFSFTLEMWGMYLNLYNKHFEKEYEFIVLINYQECIYRGTDLNFLEKMDLDELDIFLIDKNRHFSEVEIQSMLYGIPDDFIGLHNILDNRESAILIELLETCEIPEGSGLRVVEIPFDVVYHITTYSDESWSEVIEEVHRRFTSRGCRIVGVPLYDLQF